MGTVTRERDDVAGVDLCGFCLQPQTVVDEWYFCGGSEHCRNEMCGECATITNHGETLTCPACIHAAEQRELARLEAWGKSA